jgi:hypothetical protein
MEGGSNIEFGENASFVGYFIEVILKYHLGLTHRLQQL